MTTVRQIPERAMSTDPGRPGLLVMREFWGAISIAFMWLAVLFDGVYGHDFVSANTAGSQTTTIPSVVFVAVFAALATWSVAKRAFARDTSSSPNR